VPLSKLAQEVIASIPIIDAADGSDYLFSFDGKRAVRGCWHYQRKLDEEVRKKLPNFQRWQLRDLRRTARTLMSRAGIPTEIAEHCLGHAMGQIRATYDKHHYLHEKRDAFAKLAALIDRIVNPPTGNVIAMSQRG
jgi:integrase